MGAARGSLLFPSGSDAVDRRTLMTFPGPMSDQDIGVTAPLKKQ
jgi:hypothetical protein